MASKGKSGDPINYTKDKQDADRRATMLADYPDGGKNIKSSVPLYHSPTPASAWQNSWINKGAAAHKKAVAARKAAIAGMKAVKGKK